MAESERRAVVRNRNAIGRLDGHVRTLEGGVIQNNYDIEVLKKNVEALQTKVAAIAYELAGQTKYIETTPEPAANDTVAYTQTEPVKAGGQVHGRRLLDL